MDIRARNIGFSFNNPNCLMMQLLRVALSLPSLLKFCPQRSNSLPTLSSHDIECFTSLDPVRCFLAVAIPMPRPLVLIDPGCCSVSPGGLPLSATSPAHLFLFVMGFQSGLSLSASVNCTRYALSKPKN
jgi:hypothetical protein